MSVLVLGMSSFMSSDDSEGRSGWGSGEHLTADSFLRSFPSIIVLFPSIIIATQVAIIIIAFLGTHHYVMNPIVSHHYNIRVQLEFPGFTGFQSATSNFFLSNTMFNLIRHSFPPVFNQQNNIYISILAL